jgi:hypothetical protein
MNAEAIAPLQITPLAGRMFGIPPHAGLDHITVFTQDLEPGKGRVFVECYGRCWSAYWGAMGKGSSVLDFLARVDAGYLANNLIWGLNQGVITSNSVREKEQRYLEKISDSVVRAARELRAGGAQ